MHIGSGLLKPVFLLPSAVLYGVARHCCGSVRAAIILHVLNNGLVTALAMAAYLLD